MVRYRAKHFLAVIEIWDSGEKIQMGKNKCLYLVRSNIIAADFCIIYR